MTRATEPASRGVAADGDERIAEDLEADRWSVQAGFFEPPVVSELRDEALELRRRGRFRPAEVGRGLRRELHPEIRGDRILWLEPPFSPAQQRYLDEMERLRLALNRRLYLGLFRFEAQLALFEPGAGYTRHLDAFDGERDRKRVVSCTLYLNRGWGEGDGGELRLWSGPEPGARGADIAPREGTLVVFLSERVHHEVLPAARERLSLTGWFGARP